MKLEKQYCQQYINYSELGFSMLEAEGKLMSLGAWDIKQQPNWILFFKSKNSITVKMLKEAPEKEWRLCEKIARLQWQIDNLNERIVNISNYLYNKVDLQAHTHFWQKGIKR